MKQVTQSLTVKPSTCLSIQCTNKPACRIFTVQRKSAIICMAVKKQQQGAYVADMLFSVYVQHDFFNKSIGISVKTNKKKLVRTVEQIGKICK